MGRVVIDLERLRMLHCGLGQFSLRLGNAILELADQEVEPVFLMRGPAKPLFQRPVRTLQAAFWRREHMQRWLRPLARAGGMERFDLWHVTHQDSDFFPLHPSVPVVLTIHDLNFLREKPPATIRKRVRRLQNKVDRSTIITTASKFAAGEIREYFELRGREIAIIPHGNCLQHPAGDDQRPACLPAGPFLFTIGEVMPKKNFHVLVEFAVRLPEYRVLIAGNDSRGYAKRIRELATAAGLGSRFILAGEVSEAERSWLYRHCDAFVFPSLSEGFGLPVIEAMSCGRPVFSSSATSLPEVGGPHAFYWNDFDPDSMAKVFRQGMAQIASNPNHSNQLRSHASQFTWPVAARAYLALYKKALQTPALVRAA